MLALGLHPLGGNGPNTGVQVNLAPLRADDFTSATGGQDQEPQGQGRDSGLARQFGHESGNVGVVHGRMVFDLGHPGGPGQELIQVSAPAGRVDLVAPLVGGGEVQDVLDAPLNPLGRLGLAGPDG